MVDFVDPGILNVALISKKLQKKCVGCPLMKECESFPL
jgi:hypothetical protein